MRRTEEDTGFSGADCRLDGAYLVWQHKGISGLSQNGVQQQYDKNNKGAAFLDAAPLDFIDLN